MSDKINRLAVLLCGELRMWEQASTYIFDAMESRAEQVDYYFATWDKTRTFWWPEHSSEKTSRPVSADEITSKFVDRNLINYKLINQETALPRFGITMYYQSYLAKIANTCKRRYELDNNFVYDQVVELRPDIFIKNKQTHEQIRSYTDFEYAAGLVYLDNTISFPQITDFYSRLNSITNDVIANRHYYRKSVKLDNAMHTLTHWPTRMNNHWVLLDYIYARRLISVGALAELGSQIIIRPNFPKDDLNNYSESELHERFTTPWLNWQWTHDS